MVWGMTKGQCSLWFKKRVDRVLWVGCLSSWKTDVTLKWLLEEQARVNPFDRITIASAWNRDLRKNRMEPNTITSEHFHGWRLKTNFSTASLEWLLWEEQKLGRCLQPAGNQGEYRIPYGRYAVGGYDSEDNIVCEFQGCLWHGCRAYYPNKTEEHRFLEDCRMIDVYLCTQEKFQFLRDKGYNVVEMWECQWCKMKE